MPALSNVSSRLEANTISPDATSIGSPLTIDLPSLIYGRTISLVGNISRYAKLAHLPASSNSSHFS